MVAALNGVVHQQVIQVLSPQQSFTFIGITTTSISIATITLQNTSSPIC
jgi:hypothetical protein